MHCKTCLLLLMSVFLQKSFAQNIPNGTFENWTQTTAGLTLDGWKALTTGIVRSNMAGGGFGLQMQTIAGPTASQISCSFPFTQRPLNFRFLGGYKRSLSTDEAIFTVFLYKSNAGQRDTISFNEFKWNENTASGNSIAMIEKTFDLIYQAGGNPDSCELIITHAVSSIASPIGLGTILMIDNIVFRDWAAGFNNSNHTVTAGVSVYPNPATAAAPIFISSITNEPVKIDLFDLNGCLIRTVHNNILAPGEYRFGLDISSLSAGVYLLKTETPSFSQTQKLVVNP